MKKLLSILYFVIGVIVTVFGYSRVKDDALEYLDQLKNQKGALPVAIIGHIIGLLMAVFTWPYIVSRWIVDEISIRRMNKIIKSFEERKVPTKNG